MKMKKAAPVFFQGLTFFLLAIALLAAGCVPTAPDRCGKYRADCVATQSQLAIAQRDLQAAKAERAAHVCNNRQAMQKGEVR